MKKRLISLFLVLLIAAVFVFPAAAAGDGAPYVRDYAGLLSDSELEELEQKAESLEENYQCCTYVLTIDSLQGAERRDYAKQYYIDNELGCGTWKNGILFLVAMESREYVTITYGRDPDNLTDYGIGINAFSDYGVEKLEDKVVPELSDEDYYDAFDTYLSTCESYLKQYTETGEAFDVGNEPKSKLVPALITIFVPLLIALLVCIIFWSQMKTAVKATQADDYIPKDGFNLTHQIDQYTHTTQTRRTIERSNSSGGGSSVDSGGFGGSSGGHF